MPGLSRPASPARQSLPHRLRCRLLTGSLLFSQTLLALAAQEGSPADPTAAAAKAGTLTVTATKVAADQSAVPATVTVVDAAELRSAGTRNLADLWPQLSNVSAFSDRPDGYLAIRGVGSGETPRTGGDENPTRGMHSGVALIIDGLPVEATRGLSVFSGFLDVERVEVLKGPQGTLYGRNALGGVVAMTSRDPGDRWNGEGRLSAGSERSVAVSAAAGGPLVEGVGGRLAAGWSRSDGDLKNRTTGDKDTAGWRQTQARGKVAWSASDDLDVRLTASAARGDGSTDHWVAFEQRKQRETQANNPGDRTTDGGGAVVQADWRSSPVDTVTVIAGGVTARDQVAYDGDRGPNDAANVDGVNRATTGSVELRWNHRGEAVSWLAGAFAEDERTRYDTETRFSSIDPGFGLPYYALIGFPQQLSKQSDGDSRSAAVFGETTWQVGGGIALTAGLRLAWDYSAFTWRQTTTNTPLAPGGPVIPGDLTSDHADADSRGEFLPKAVIAWTPTEATMVYVSAVRGYRAGGFNTNASSPASARLGYGPESTWNYELGLRSRWLDRRLRLDLTGFYTDWTDKQVFTSRAPYDVVIENAARSHTAGAELTLAWHGHDGLSAWADGGLLDTRYDRRTGQVTRGGTLSTVDYVGREFALAPRWTWAVGGAYQHASGAFVRVDGHGHGRAWIDDENTAETDTVALLDARIGFSAAQWSVALVGRNLTDATDVTDSIFIPGDTILTTDTTYVRLAPARSIAIELEARW
ncbi:TonB-dependent receptor [Planctomycetota bacterium]|nr:TonB-dependent receptor [Planctomycetota bacterium]